MRPKKFAKLPWVKLPDRRVWIKEFSIDKKKFVLRAADLSWPGSGDLTEYHIAGKFADQLLEIRFSKSYYFLHEIDDDAKSILAELAVALVDLEQHELETFTN